MTHCPNMAKRVYDPNTDIVLADELKLAGIPENSTERNRRDKKVKWN